MTSANRVFLLKVFIHLAALTPLFWLYYHAFTDQLGADPVEYVIHFTGKGSLHVLMLTLLVTPLAKRFKWPALMQSRRLLGLYAFTYAAFHLGNFIAFEIQLDLSLLVSEIIERPYITIGMLAFAILLTLAVTSPNAVRRRMGKNWQKLHNAVYLAVLLVVIHYIWSVKSEIIEPTVYILLVLFILSHRKDKLVRWWRKRQA